MYNVSAAFLAKIKESSRTIKSKVDINGTVLFEDDIIDFNIRGSFGNNSIPTIGSVVAAKLELKLLNTVNIPFMLVGVPIVPYVAIEITTGVYEWVKLGTFYAESGDVDKTDKVIEIECLDGLPKYNSIVYTTALTYPATIQAMMAEMTTNYGIQFATQTLPSVSFPAAPVGTVRQVLSQIAALITTNAVMNPDDKIEFKFLSTPDTVNYAANILPTGSSGWNNLSKITDGDKTTANYAGSSSGLRWVQIDVGSPKNINGVKMWRYFTTARQYHDVIVQLSNDPTFTTGVTTVFNNDTDNSAGLGVGTDSEYTETSDGKVVTFSPINARYIRFYSNGSTANVYNHIVEIEVNGYHIDSDNYIDFKLTSDARLKISQLTVTKDKDTSYSAGDGTGYALSFENDALNSIGDVQTVFNRQFPLYFYAYNMKAQGMPHIQPGDTISFLDKNNVARTIAIVNHKFSYNGGMISEFTVAAPEKETTEITPTESKVSGAISQASKTFLEAIASATAMITGNVGGNIVTVLDEYGKPCELCFIDTDDINTAVKVWRWNISGLGYSSNGYTGHYETAITADGKISAKFITVDTMSAAILYGGLLSSKDGKNWIDLEPGGKFSLADGKISFDGTTFSIDLSDADMASAITQNADSVKIAVGEIGTNNLIFNSSCDFLKSMPKTYVYRKMPNGANFDYRWTRIHAVPPSAEAGNFNSGSTLKTFFSTPSNYKKYDFWKIGPTDSVPSGRAVGDIMWCTNTNSGSYDSDDWEWDIGDDDAKFLINDTYGSYPKIDILAQTDDFMIAYHQASAPHAEYSNIADNATYNENVGNLWLDSDAMPTTSNVPTSWMGTYKTDITTGGGYVEGDAFKVVGGVNDEYFMSQERITAIPSKPYIFQGAIKATSDLAGTGAQFEVVEYDTNGAVITSHLTDITKATAWTIYTISFITNASAKYFRVKQIVKGTATPVGYVLFDRLKLENGANLTAWRASENEMKTTAFELTEKYAKFLSQNGSYTMLDPANDGMTWHRNGVSRDYHYLVEVGEGTVASDTTITKTLADTAFRGKDFKVVVSLKEIGQDVAGDWMIMSSVAMVSTDIKNGKFDVTGKMYSQNGTGTIKFTYIAVA